MNYFTADTHFFDQHLLFGSDFAPARGVFYRVIDMNQTIVNHWNEVVQDEDTVYHLGDIAVLHSKPASQAHEEIAELLDRLNGRIVFVRGNHDSKALFRFLEQHNPEKYTHEDVGIYRKANHHQFYMTHYPMIFGKNKNLINLHGHIHHSAVNIKDNLNVGIDSIELDYLMSDQRPAFGAPLSEQQIELMIQAKWDDYAKRR